MKFISKPMGWLLAQLSNMLGDNFAASVLVFTILVNLLMLPLTIKSQKSTVKQAKLKPKLDALKKKYGNDKQKYSQAMSELYAKEGVSMSGGCLPMIIRLFVMMGVYWAVISPLTYVQQIDTDAIEGAKLQTQFVKTVEVDGISWEDYDLQGKIADEEVIATAQKYGSENVEFYAKLAIVEEQYEASTEAVKKAVEKNAITQETELVSYLKGSNENYASIKDVYSSKGGKIEDLEKIDFTFLGIELTDTPHFSWNFAEFELIWLIPLSSFAAAMITSIISMVMQKKANPDAPNMAFMMLIMPLFSLYIAFKVPGAVGFYWTCSNIVASGLQYITQAMYGPNVMLAREQSANIVKRAKVEQEKIDRALNSGEQDLAE